MSDGPEVETLLEDRPEFESAFEALLDVDETHETWTFDDVPVDSGTFGELVGRGVVEKVDDDYRLADPGAVRAALEAEPEPGAQSPDADATGVGPDVTTPGSGPVRSALDVDPRTFDTRLVAALIGCLVLVVALRSLKYGSVFRAEHIVLASNDPYYYHHLVESALDRSGGTLAASTLSNIPFPNGEPLLIATLWAITVIAGPGSVTAVLAVYPPVAAVISALLVYALSTRVADDRRVGLAAVAVLAVLPAHALRTGLGFADHHAFDYIWLSLTALSLVVLVSGADGQSIRRRRMATAGLAVGVAGQVLAWEAGPLLVVPVGVVVLVLTLLDVRDGGSPLERLWPIAAGVGASAALVLLAHYAFGWHTAMVAHTTTALALGVAGVVGLAEAARRLDWSTRRLAAVDAAAGVGSLAVLRFGFPATWADAASRVGRLFFRTRDVIETQQLFSTQSFGFLFLFGTVLVFALPVLAWGVREAARGERPWVVVTVYGWYLFVLSAVQVRFGGEFSIFASVAGGYALVYLVATVTDSTRPGEFGADVALPTPDRQTVATVVVLFILVGGLGVVQTAIKVNQTAIPEDYYETAAWMGEYADERGWDDSRSSYVFSVWGPNRMYNHFVSGNSRSYAFAQQNYADFLRATDGRGWYLRLRDRVGFVVISSEYRFAGSQLHSRLNGYGSRRGDTPGLSHYRAVYRSDTGRLKVFTLVEGAYINGTAPPNRTVAVSTEVEIPGASFDYRRQARSNATGHYSVVVPYPGEYTVGNETVTVPESAVRE